MGTDLLNRNIKVLKSCNLALDFSRRKTKQDETDHGHFDYILKNNYFCSEKIFLFVSIYDDNQVDALLQYGFIRSSTQILSNFKKKYVQRIAMIFIYDSTTAKSTLLKGCLISEYISNLSFPQKVCKISVHQLLNVEKE